ncbi:Methyl-accepting chemotaxis protein [Carboxydocella sporoproducens DSM 16521]|uniref:Methyl-accepting chemotaxis protein n=2 Tax=Carboxydocella TaxID=178898 RepID=A0A1T4PN69_9FIRM|nr:MULTISPECIES: methyl-accepting chemotaxis protein [Carboxydocella]AVX19469.1 Methyl-accepting chemotaxis protein [Carboxydocella thermautotrophica]SJZ92667.1 Methyl-accepting chemotaxis protein [Carboxydocella sporoproducens DSM 16521]
MIFTRWKYRPFWRLGVVFLTVTGGGTLIWTAFLAWYLEVPDDKLLAIFGPVIPIGVVAAAAILAYVNRLLVEVLTIFADAAKRVAEKDLTTTIYFPTSDIFGKTAEAFNKMIVDVRATVQQSAVTAEGVTKEAVEVSKATESATASIQQISAAMEQIAGGSQRQADEILETVQTMQEISAAVSQVAAHSQQAFASSQQAAQLASKGLKQVEEAVAKMHAISEAVQTSSAAVEKLYQRSTYIGEIVNVITGIADQTNLLALNAAIEAARAGEHGRGFAVVADEVRKLAEGSGEAAQKIGELIEEIQAETASAALAMTNGNREVEDGVKVALKAKQALDEIHHAVLLTEEMVQGISKASQEQSQGLSQLAGAVEKISGIAQQFSTATQQVAASLEQQMSANEQINVLSYNLVKLAEELKRYIDNFKVQ